MKPYRTLLLLSLVLILLFGPSFFIKGPVRITGILTFSFPPLPEQLSSVFSTISDTSSVKITDRDKKDQSGSNSREPSCGKVQGITDEVTDSTGNEEGERLSAPDYPIESFFPDTLWQTFLESLSHRDRQVRILFYGDSQIEEDRLTDSLRSGLRQISGGSGPGLLSITPVVDFTRTSWVKAGREWKRYNYLTYRRGEIASPALGPMFSYSRFTPSGTHVDEIRSATVTISPSPYSDNSSAWYGRMRMFYGNLKDTLEITLNRGRTIISKDTLLPRDGINQYSRIVESSEGITITMRGRSSPDIYGISLESDSGLIVDNISGRGSAGLEFALAEQESLATLMNMLAPDLIVLHYGLNLVRNNSASYSYYEDALVRQMEVLRGIVPDVPVLVMGVTDMARSDTAGVESFPSVSQIVEAQRNAAERGNALFWDSRRAMGGEGAVVRWREEEPPLAAADYAHLTYQGANRLAGMLLESIIYEYRKSLVDKEEKHFSDEEADSKRGISGYGPGDYSGDSLPGQSMVAPPGTNISRQPDRVTSTGQLSGSTGFKIGSSVAGFNPESPFLFTAVSFWMFMFVLLAGYSVIYSKPFLRNGYLFFFSLFFYYKSGGLFFFLLLISTITDYTAARLIYTAVRKSVKRFFLVVSLIVNLGMLAYFKYAVFLTDAVNELFNISLPVTDWLSVLSNRHLGTSFDISVIILPVGISFFTFQTISYTMDIYRGRIKPVTNIADFGFYVSFFPQLVAGPIVRASEFVPQLYTRFTLSAREWGHALFLILSGLIKKIVISDYIAVNMIDRVFSSPGAFSGLENLLAVYGYGLQIYCDFSGYTDIAIGIALMLGYRLPLNFNSPYKASSVTDFWRRWHISLSRWLRDYLYIPLGGNRKGGLRTSVNIIITMLLGGLWHGAAWRFVAWGALHGVGIVIEKGFVSLKSRWHTRGNTAFKPRGFGGKLARFAALLITFNFISFCWIFFRAPDMDHVKIMLLRIFSSFLPSGPLASLAGWGSVLTVIGAGYLLHFLPVRVKEAYRGLFISLPMPVKILITWFIGLALYNISMTGAQPFIYFRF